MTSNTLKQKRFRDRMKERGMVVVQFYIHQDELKNLKEMYEFASDPGNSFREFQRKSLIRGACFVANTGKGRRIKNTGTSYTVPKE